MVCTNGSTYNDFFVDNVTMLCYIVIEDANSRLCTLAGSNPFGYLHTLKKSLAEFR